MYDIVAQTFIAFFLVGRNSAPGSGAGVGDPLAHLLRVAAKTDLRHAPDPEPRAGVRPRCRYIVPRVSPGVPDSPTHVSAGIRGRSPESRRCYVL